MAGGGGAMVVIAAAAAILILHFGGAEGAVSCDEVQREMSVCVDYLFNPNGPAGDTAAHNKCTDAIDQLAEATAGNPGALFDVCKCFQTIPIPDGHVNFYRALELHILSDSLPVYQLLYDSVNRLPTICS